MYPWCVAQPTITFFTDLSLHATLETSGSVLMLLLALLIFKFDNNQFTLTHTHYVALALISMGVINLLFAASDNENHFIWPHVTSTLLGAILLLGVFLPNRMVTPRLYFTLPIMAGLVTAFIALVLFDADNFIPNTKVSDQFDDTDLYFYSLATLLYLMSTAHFTVRFWQTQQSEDFYLAAVISLLAITAFLLHFTHVWGLSWWYWHAIKLLAFVTLLLYFIDFISKKNNNFIAREIDSNIIKYSVDAIITKSLDSTILTWNASAEKLFGYTASEIIGQKSTLLYQPDWILQEIEITTKILSGTSFSQFETNFVAKDHALIDVAVTLSPIKNQSGNIIGISKIVRDMREQKAAKKAIRDINIELERKVNERTIQLQNAYDEMEAFTYSVSHDLRSPLRATDGFSQALLEDYGDHLDSAAKDYLTRIRLASQKMAGLIDDLLQLSRQTRTDMEPKTINLSILAQKVIDDLAQLEPDRHVEVIIAPNLTAYADEHLMTIALTNLLGNAWKYTGHEPLARIELSSQSEGDEIVYCIKDNGAGFDMAYVDKLFKPFQRLHTTQEFLGNGIGLAMVYRIVKRHMGRVWAQGEIGKGATFYFTIKLTNNKAP